MCARHNNIDLKTFWVISFTLPYGKQHSTFFCLWSPFGRLEEKMNAAILFAFLAADITRSTSTIHHNFYKHPDMSPCPGTCCFNSLQTQMKYSKGKILFQHPRLPIFTTLRLNTGMARNFRCKIIPTSLDLLTENNKRSAGKGPRLSLDGPL